MKQLAKTYGVSYARFRKRLESGMDIMETLFEPSRTNKKVSLNGRDYPSVTKLAEAEIYPPAC